MADTKFTDLSAIASLATEDVIAVVDDPAGTPTSKKATMAQVATVVSANLTNDSVVTAKVDDDAITYAKIQNVSATDKILGRSTAGAGVVEEIDCTAAGRALLDDADAAAQRTTLGLAIGTNVQAFDADILKADTTDELAVGYSAAVHDAGTKSSGTFTPDEADGNKQRCVNGGAFTLAPPTNYTNIELLIDNNGSAGAITTSGFTAVKGDSFTTTDTHMFLCSISTTYDGAATISVLTVQALQ